MDENGVYGLAVSYYTCHLGPLHPNKIEEYLTREQIIEKSSGIRTEEFVDEMVACLKRAVNANIQNKVGGYETVHAHLYYFRSFAHAQARDFALGKDELDNGILDDLAVAIYNSRFGNFQNEDDSDVKWVLISVSEAARLFEEAGFPDHRLSMKRIVTGRGFGLMSDFINTSGIPFKTDENNAVVEDKNRNNEVEHNNDVELPKPNNSIVDSIKQRKKDKKRKKKERALQM